MRLHYIILLLPLQPPYIQQKLIQISISTNYFHFQQNSKAIALLLKTSSAKIQCKTHHNPFHTNYFMTHKNGRLIEGKLMESSLKKHAKEAQNFIRYTENKYNFHDKLTIVYGNAFIRDLPQMRLIPIFLTKCEVV